MKSYRFTNAIQKSEWRFLLGTRSKQQSIMKLQGQVKYYAGGVLYVKEDHCFVWISDPGSLLIRLQRQGTALLHETDTIGWFGDGYILSELECSDESVLNDIMNDEHWKRLPLSENMHRFFYEDYHFPNDLPIPVIKEGYYFFYDRHDQAKDPYDDAELYDRASFNFTFAIYDTKENKLYVCEFNT